LGIARFNFIFYTARCILSRGTSDIQEKDLRVLEQAESANESLLLGKTGSDQIS